MNRFELHSKYAPAGDQPKAIDELVRGVEENKRAQVLLGVTAVSYTHLSERGRL